MTSTLFSLYTLLIYCTAFMFVYISEIIYEEFVYRFIRFKSIFRGAMLGLSLSVVIFIVELLNITGIQDGRFVVVLISTSLLGPIGGLFTGGLIFITSLIVTTLEWKFLLASFMLYYLIGYLIHIKKNKTLKIHIALNVIASVLCLIIGVSISRLYVQPVSVVIDIVKSNMFWGVILISAFTFLLSVMLVREENRTTLIYDFNQKKKTLELKSSKINQLNTKLLDSQEKYELVLKASDEGFVEYNHLSKTMVLSERALEIFDHMLQGPEVSLWDMFECLEANDAKRVQEEFKQLKLGQKEMFNIQLKIKQKADEFRHISFKGIVKRNEKEDISIVGSIKDIHDRIIREEMIYDLAYKDEITGLLNENAFINSINSSLSKKLSGNLLFINIIGFSNYGALGVSYKNIIRMHLAGILKKFFSLEECYYLQEGCFCIHINEILDFESAQVKFEDLTLELEKPIRFRKVLIPLKINGIFLNYPLGNYGSEGLISRGLLAITNLEKNKIVELVKFNEIIYNQQIRISQIENFITNGLEINEFYIVYQPQYDKDGDNIVGYEALIRWKSKELGLVSPCEFIPIAEKSGAIYNLGKFVVKSVCQFIKLYKSMYGISPRISINVSFVELINPSFAIEFKNMILDAEIEANLIVIEITETAISDFVDIVLGNIRILRAFGFEIHLDDFGTGYSSLNHMSKLAVDVIKIDKSFIDEIYYNDTMKNLVMSIINLAHSIHMDVIAEGVEKKEQFDLLQSLNCDYYQGYYFSKPLEVQDILNKRLNKM